jgi:hypothetical protein
VQSSAALSIGTERNAGPDFGFVISTLARTTGTQASLALPIGAIRRIETDGMEETKLPFGFALPQ